MKTARAARLSISDEPSCSLPVENHAARQEPSPPPELLRPSQGKFLHTRCMTYAGRREEAGNSGFPARNRLHGCAQNQRNEQEGSKGGLPQRWGCREGGANDLATQTSQTGTGGAGPCSAGECLSTGARPGPIPSRGDKPSMTRTYQARGAPNPACVTGPTHSRACDSGCCQPAFPLVSGGTSVQTNKGTDPRPQKWPDTAET